MARPVSGIQKTTVQAFPGAPISGLHHRIDKNQASIDYKYTIILIGTNYVAFSKSVD